MNRSTIAKPAKTERRFVDTGQPGSSLAILENTIWFGADDLVRRGGGVAHTELEARADVSRQAGERMVQGTYLFVERESCRV